MTGSYLSQGESNTFTSQTSLTTNAFKREKKNKSPFKKNLFKTDESRSKTTTFVYQTQQSQAAGPSGFTPEIYTSKDTSAVRQKSPG